MGSSFKRWDFGFGYQNNKGRDTSRYPFSATEVEHYTESGEVMQLTAEIFSLQCRSLSNNLNIQKAHSRITLEKDVIISFQLFLPAYGTGYKTPFMLLFLTSFIF